MTKQHVNAAEISKNIKKLRDALGWNQSKLAQEAKISGAALSKIEQGEGRIPTIVVLQKLASALKVQISEITGEVPSDAGTGTKLSEFYRKFGVLDSLPEKDQKLLLEMAERVNTLRESKEQ